MVKNSQDETTQNTSDGTVINEHQVLIGYFELFVS